jgi:oxygen-independent coproporphyrinogen-3 oxidase
MKLYEQAIDNGELPIFKGYKLSQDDVIRQFVIMELMSNFSLNIPRVEKEFNINFQDYFKNDLPLLQEFVEADLVSIDDEKIQVSQTGTMLIRNIVMPFDAYLKRIPENKRRFSKTI